MLLKGKTALITGAGRGIGRGIALAFAQQGCSIAAAARTADEVNATVDLVKRAGGGALALLADVANPQDVRAMADETLRAFGAIDILVNNAGYASFRPFTELSLEEWQQTIAVNLTGVFLCCKAVVPSMIARKSGRIINISSVAGLKPLLNQSAYCASKHGLNGFSKVLAMELREHHVAVHTICPGGVDTRLAQEAMPDRDKSDWMTPEDIAHACLYLATLSPRASTDELVVRRFNSAPIGG
ncbi:MAG TPA: SDR family oxidoreductase [Candidatus Hydrogenedentes bacterium]|nr:SDR family oxidoreductase [Candidatus Hydrogenedentota bacterium]HRK33820.1 SDR family oxidoreductase [Candidatus Hydrogenedentota bacterium]